MLLFDLDGTLIDSNQAWVEVDNTFLFRRGLTPTEEYNRVVGQSIFPVAAQFTRDYYHLSETPQQIMDEWMSLIGEAYGKHIPLKPGAKEFLAHCADQGRKMALVTACVPELCHTVLQRHGLAQFFPVIIFAQELGVEKRNPRFFQAVLDHLEADPQDCTLFEDSPAACRTAKEAGIRVVGVYDPFYASHQEEMEGVCDRYIRSFTEVL